MQVSVQDWLRQMQQQCFYPDEVSPAFRRTNEELVQIRDKVFACLARPEQDAVASVPVALLSLTSPNAYAFRLPSGGYGICFDYTLVAALRVLNTLILYQACKMIGKSQMANLVDSVIGAFARRKRVLRDALRDVFEVLDVALAAAQKTHEPSLLEMIDKGVGAATYYQHVFLLGHECAHILSGHLDEARTALVPTLTNSSSGVALEVYTSLRQHEREADQKAGAVFCTTIPKDHLEHAYDFVDVMWEFFCRVERRLQAHGLLLVETHPPASERQAAVNIIMANALGRPCEPGGYRYVFDGVQPAGHQ
jgi:hypothetical protein